MNRYTHARFQDFLPRLKIHLLLRLRGQSFQGVEQAFTATELNPVIIEDQTTFSYKVARFNYTTYDGRREQDSIGTRKNANVICWHTRMTQGLWYARVVGVFHCRVIHNTPSASILIMTHKLTSRSALPIGMCLCVTAAGSRPHVSGGSDAQLS